MQRTGWSATSFFYGALLKGNDLQTPGDNAFERNQSPCRSLTG